MGFINRPGASPEETRRSSPQGWTWPRAARYWRTSTAHYPSTGREAGGKWCMTRGAVQVSGVPMYPTRGNRLS